MKPHILTLLFLLILSTFQINAQEEPQYVETQATITALDSKIRGRSSTETASITYITESGDTIASQTRLFHIPFLGSFKNVGDQITIQYQKDNPYVVKSANESFLQAYGLYILIGIAVILTGYRILQSRKKEINT